MYRVVAVVMAAFVLFCAAPSGGEMSAGHPHAYVRAPTVPVAEFGCDITAVDLGPATVEVARRNPRPFPRVRVEVAEFEQWPLPEEPFDVVMCATAFHWLDPEVRVAKVGRALRPGGTFALVTTEHVKGGTLGFFAHVAASPPRHPGGTRPLRSGRLVRTRCSGRRSTSE